MKNAFIIALSVAILVAGIGYAPESDAARSGGGYRPPPRQSPRMAPRPAPSKKSAPSKQSAAAPAKSTKPGQAGKSESSANAKAPAGQTDGKKSKSNISATNQKSQEKVDSVLGGAKARGNNTRGPSTIFDKSGGKAGASKDFDAMGLKNQKQIPGGRVGELPDGRKVVQRDANKDERLPTLEIQEKGRERKKIRYAD